jgi:hypothetical protein
MAIEGANAYTGSSGDGFQASLRTTGAENDFCCLKDSLAISNRVGARLSRALLGLPHAKPTYSTREGLEKRRLPPYLRTRHADTEYPHQAIGNDSPHDGMSAVSLNYPGSGALHEQLNDSDCEWREENDRAR